jgi:hypothetical protein
MKLVDPLAASWLRAALVALVAVACAAPSDHARAPLATTPEASRLAQDVRWLADDAREGRRAGTRGEAEAARWLAQRLEALGLEPAGSAGFLQGFEVPLPPKDGGASFLEVAREDMRFVSEAGELVPLFCSSGGKVEGPLVFAGYGIADADLGRDDFAGLELSGSIAVIVRGTPPDSLLPKAAEAGAGEPAANPHGAAQPVASSWGGAGAIFYKVMEAKRRGAKAVIVAQHPAREEALLAFQEGGGAEAKIPAFNASAALLERVLPGYGERVARLDAGEAPPAPPAAKARVHADVERARGPATNVLGRLRGADSGRVLVIGAHFDHLGHGGSGSLAPNEQGQIHNGADDNASGTAAVLEIARCLAAGPQPACDVVFALWSGEELGLLGSEHWARQPTFALDSVVANLNLDMVGRAESGKLSILGAGSAKEFSGTIALSAPRSGLAPEVSLSGQGVGGSDHQTFLKREIPALHLFTGLHPDYHRPSDDYERFEPAGAARVAALVLDLVDDLATAQLAWVPPAKEAAQATPGGFKTRFGSIPDYAFDGTGMRLDGTSPGGPAEKAGLLRGDVILAVGDTKIDALGDFMHALNSHKPGDVVTVRYLRDGVEETCQVTLESSQVE